MTARVTLLVAAAMAIAVLAVGCGGGGDGGGDEGSDSASKEIATSSLKKAAFVKKADSICRSGAEEAVEGPETASQPEGQSFGQTVTVAMVPAFRGVVDKIYKLGAPSGDEAQIEAFLEAMGQEVDAIEENSASLKSLEDVASEFQGSTKLAHSYGILACTYAE